MQRFDSRSSVVTTDSQLDDRQMMRKPTDYKRVGSDESLRSLDGPGRFNKHIPKIEKPFEDPSIKQAREDRELLDKQGRLDIMRGLFKKENSTTPGTPGEQRNDPTRFFGITGITERDIVSSKSVEDLHANNSNSMTVPSGPGKSASIRKKSMKHLPSLKSAMVRCGARIPTTKRNLKDVTNQSGLPSKDDPASTSDPNLPYARHDYDLYDFKIKEQIGRGAFATVHLVKFAPRNLQDVSQPAVSEKSYAMKALRKKDIIATKQIKHVMNEKTILENVRFPFIVELLATFQDIKHLYLVMEYIPGGDMFTLLRKRRRFPESVARFYSSELVLALEYLHSKKIIYRDLKPENILIDVEGHIKIADFGFAKTVSETAQTFCGTPAYMAPEIILKTGYNKTVDWWSLGTLIYEMLAGYSPFIAATPLEIYENVLDGKISWSSQIGSTSKDLLKHLIEMIPRKRFGAGHWPNETKEIKGHPWFAGVNWRSIEDKKIAPPFTPKVTGTEDISNFDKYNEPSSVLEAAKGNVGKSEDGLYDEVFKDF